jgi:hypothetical protein
LDSKLVSKDTLGVGQSYSPPANKPTFAHTVYNIYVQCAYPMMDFVGGLLLK